MEKRKLTKRQKDFKEKCFNPFLRKVYKLFSENPEVFIFDKIDVYNIANAAVAGLCDWETIKVDPYLLETNLVSVTLHEAAHWFNPDWKEERVLRFEKRCMKVISPVQYKRLLSLITQNL